MYRQHVFKRRLSNHFSSKKSTALSFLLTVSMDCIHSFDSGESVIVKMESGELAGVDAVLLDSCDQSCALDAKPLGSA